MTPAKFFQLLKVHADLNDPERAKKESERELSIEEAKRWAIS